MLFWLKKLISQFLLPLPFGLSWIALGLLLLLANRAKTLQKTSLIIGFSILFLFSFYPVSFALLNHLQSQYSPLTSPPTSVNKIVVLGGGISGNNKNFPPNLTLNAASLSRLIESARLYKIIEKTHPDAILILSGGRVFQSFSNAGKMQNTAVMLGVPSTQTILENGSSDTHDEAVYLQKMVGTQSFILVTSAFHMPRAMALFQSHGMHPIAAPTQFFLPLRAPFIWLIPSANNLTMSDTAIHEYFGILWARMRGYIGK